MSAGCFDRDALLRALRRGVAMAALVLLPACLPPRQVTVGETQVGQGLLY